MGRVSVLVADSQRLLAESVATALSAQPELQPADQVAVTGREAVELATSLRPHVVVLDYWISGQLDGAQATAAIRERAPGTQVLILSGLPGPLQVQAALAAGAAGFLPKAVAVADLADAVRRAHRGDSPVFVEELWRMVESINERAQQTEEIDTGLASLSDRELEVIRLLPEGRPVKDLAAELFITEGTLRNHLHSILRKTGAANQQELLRLVRNGAPSMSGLFPGAAAWEPPEPAAEGLTVLIADEQRLLAQSLAQGLAGLSDLAVLGAYSGNGIDPLQAAIRLAPRVLVYDYWMPGTTGAAVARYLRRWAPQTRVVLSSWLHGPAQVEDAVLSGAAGLVPKSLSLAEMAQTIRDAGAGRPLAHAASIRGRTTAPAPSPPTPLWEVVEALSPRELEVLQWVGQGRTFHEIARHLDIRPGTVKNHVSSVLSKTGSRSRLEAVEVARQAGLVREPGVPPMG